MKFEAWAVAPRVTKFRWSDGSEETGNALPSCVTLTIHMEGGSTGGGFMTLYLHVDQADQLASKLADADAAARAMPVEERVYDNRPPKAGGQ
jgi:hypothetical protein